jgi:geranyl-CoA carboxylase alpha subunit
MIEKILVANRGEIALRVIRTAKDMGFRTVAVYSDADKDALHAGAADEAVPIGPPQPAESYLCVAKIIDAAKISGADAIHPGYGFLSENPELVRACRQAEITFIGPGADAMELMGSKRLAKNRLLEAGVPCIPGYQGEEQSDETLLSEAEKIGFPVMVKASAGGGGRGMRLVAEAEKLPESLKTARTEAQRSFGSDELILEKAIVEPRHIEIQVFADAHGNAVYVGERDCSVQRRHQKVVEEAPSPFVDEALRKQMGEAAVNAARACSYLGAGTVEFIVDKEKNFYFLEMNTRLQVEHPVTELITGLDLVEWQIRIASGEPLPLSQEEIELGGHAIEVRLYAEDARRNFLPQTGRILCWKIPNTRGLRVDSGIGSGDEVSPFYDPIIAKVICRGKDRQEARRRLASALRDTILLGINNNKHFLGRILRHPVFAKGEATTGFIETHLADDESMSESALSAKTAALAAILFYENRAAASFDWHTPAPYRYQFRLECDEKPLDVSLVKKGGRFTATVGLSGREQEHVELERLAIDSSSFSYIDGGVRRRAWYAAAGDMLFIDDGTGHFGFEDRTFRIAAAARGAGSEEVKSTMNGAVVEVLVNEGDMVSAGQTLVVIESMKMQHQLAAAVSGRVEAVTTAAGEHVKPRQLLVRIAASETEGAGQ